MENLLPIFVKSKKDHLISQRIHSTKNAKNAVVRLAACYQILFTYECCDLHFNWNLCPRTQLDASSKTFGFSVKKRYNSKPLLRKLPRNTLKNKIIAKEEDENCTSMSVNFLDLLLCARSHFEGSK